MARLAGHRLNRPLTGTLVTCLTAGALGCAAEPATPPNVTRDSAGLTIVESRAPLWDSSSTWRVPAAPRLVIGPRSESDTARQFTRITGVTRLTSGAIVVLDAATTDLRWFDHTGLHLRTVRFRGPGPGELPFAFALIRLPGDTLVVHGGARPSKALFFSPTGDFVREEVMDEQRFRAAGRWGECPSLILPDKSRLVCQDLPGATPLPPDPGPGALRHFQQFVRISWDANELDTLGRYGGIEQHGLDLGQKWTFFVVHPFHARSYLAVGGDSLRIASAPNPDYSIELWRPRGGLDRIVRRPGARRAPTERERAGAIDLMRDWNRGADSAQMARIMSDVPVPDSLPAVSGLALSSSGELFVMREGLLRGQDRSAWDVFDREGRFLGALHFPAAFTVREVGPDYILGVRLNEFDVPAIEVYSLQRP